MFHQVIDTVPISLPSFDGINNGSNFHKVRPGTGDEVDFDFNPQISRIGVVFFDKRIWMGCNFTSLALIDIIKYNNYAMTWYGVR